MKYDWPKDWVNVRKDFIETFQTTIEDVYDPFLSFVEGKFMIDIIRFDDILHRKIGDYEVEGLSMKDVILREFGNKGIELINELI